MLDAEVRSADRGEPAPAPVFANRPVAVGWLDEMYVRIGGQKMWLWRAVDDEGEVLDVLVQKRRNRHAAR